MVDNLLLQSVDAGKQHTCAGVVRVNCHLVVVQYHVGDVKVLLNLMTSRLDGGGHLQPLRRKGLLVKEADNLLLAHILVI